MMIEAVNTLLDELDVHITVPDVALRVGALLEDPECDLRAVGEWIERDPVLALGVLRAASSPIFGGLNGDLDISQAVIRLGRNRTRDLVLAVGVMNCLPALVAPFDIRAFWRLGLGSALSARHIAEEYGIADQQRPYLAGLVHALGDGLLMYHDPERYLEAAHEARKTGESLEWAVSQSFGVPSHLVTAGLLRRWGIDEAVATAVAEYPEPWAAASERELAGVLFMADRIARDLCLGPDDPAFIKHCWHDQLPDEISEWLTDSGYPEVGYYLGDQWRHLHEISDIVASIYGG